MYICTYTLLYVGSSQGLHGLYLVRYRNLGTPFANGIPYLSFARWDSIRTAQFRIGTLTHRYETKVS